MDIKPEEMIEYDPEELRKELEKAAKTIDEEIEQLKQAAFPTQETMKIEFLI